MSIERSNTRRSASRTRSVNPHPVFWSGRTCAGRLAGVLAGPSCSSGLDHTTTLRSRCSHEGVKKPMSPTRPQGALSRRHVLRGLGATIALPFLDCMRPRRARASTTTALEKPKRCVFVYIPNGVNTLTWQIEQPGRQYVLPTPLASLERHRAKLTPISGLHHPTGLGKAHECDKIWLTGASLEEKRGVFRNTISADQQMAQFAGLETRFPSLELSITGGTLAWTREGVPLPAERKPSAIFERLFGVEEERSAVRERLQTRRSVLDAVLDEAKRLRQTIGSSDRSKLDEYLEAVRDVETRTRRADAWLDVPKPEVSEETRRRMSRSIPDAEAGLYYDTLYDLMVLALSTDMTRVITCMSGSESRALALPEIGIQQTRHELSHHNGDADKMHRLTQCDQFLTDHFASFLDRLESYRDEDETLLDRTIVLFGSGMSYGHSHGNANLPLILAGGGALGLQHGSHLDYNLPKIGSYELADPARHYSICLQPADSEARLSNLLLTLLQRMDVETESFADSLGPISELVA